MIAFLKKLWRPEVGIFLAVWLILIIGGRSRFFHDPGTFWHTVVGRQILSSHHLVYQDHFTFTFAGEKWIAHQWLGECLMAVIDKIDGLDSLLLATVTILAALYTWLTHRLIREGLHWALASVVLMLAIAASSSHFHIRPHIGTIALLAVMYGLLCDFEMGRIGFRQLLWLIPISIIWTNVHGGILGGLGTLVLAWAGWSAYHLIGWPSPLTGNRQILSFGLLILVCGLAVFVNPYGLDLPQAWQIIMKADLPDLIVEHAPLDPRSPGGLMILTFGTVYFFVFVGVLPGRPRVTWLLPFVWFYLSCTRIRHAPLFAATATLALADMLPATRWARWLARPGSDLFVYPVKDSTHSQRLKPASYLLPCGAVLAAFFLLIYRVPAWKFDVGPVEIATPGHGCAKLDPDYWPVDLLPELKKHQDDRPDGTPIFNEYLFGGFLIYFTPGYRVFVDDRCELFGDRWLNEYVRVEQGTQDARLAFKHWEEDYPPFDLALTRTGSAFDDYFRTSGWIRIKKTETATFYKRNNFDTLAGNHAPEIPSSKSEIRNSKSQVQSPKVEFYRQTFEPRNP
jgi:hypothetical protein